MKNEKLNLTEIQEAIRISSPSTAIYVGCDSKCFSVRGTKHVAFATAVVLHYDQSRGAKLYKGIEIQRDYGSIRQRLMNEVYLAGGVAVELADFVGERPFEVHLDINPDKRYKSSMCVKEATGYILGTMGFHPKLKPDAFIASAVSDRYAVSTAETHKRRR